jgi:hypothetical protein
MSPFKVTSLKEVEFELIHLTIGLDYPPSQETAKTAIDLT